MLWAQSTSGLGWSKSSKHATSTSSLPSLFTGERSSTSLALHLRLSVMQKIVVASLSLGLRACQGRRIWFYGCGICWAHSPLFHDVGDWASWTSSWRRTKPGLNSSIPAPVTSFSTSPLSQSYYYCFSPHLNPLCSIRLQHQSWITH